MDVRLLTDADRDAFDGYLADHPWGDILQSWAWGDLKAPSGWRPVRVAAYEDGRIVAATSLLFRRLHRLIPKSIAYASRGPTWTEERHLRPFLTGIAEIARKQGAILLKIDPPVESRETAVDAIVRAEGFRPVGREGFGGEQPKCVMQLDLAGRTEEEISAGFKQKWRYNIRVAEKKGVTVRDDAPREDMKLFHDLYCVTATRDGFTGRPLSYFERMYDLLVPRGEMRLVIVRYEGQPVAGAIIHHFGDKVTYLYGASSNEHRNVMPNHLMQWECIKRARAEGAKWYDFRGVSPKTGQGDEHLEGLNRFKEGFGPRFVEYVGEYDKPLSALWYKAWEEVMPRLRGKRG